MSSELDKSVIGGSEDTIPHADYINKGFDGVILPEGNCRYNNDSESYSTTYTKNSRWSVGNLISFDCWKIKRCCDCSRNRQIHSEDSSQTPNITSNQNCVKNSNHDLKEYPISCNGKSTHNQHGNCNQIVTCSQVRHVQQLYSWDCGISCVLMVLPDKQYNYFAKNISKISSEEGYQKSTWTIDLAYLLHRFKVPFHYTTITLGVDPRLAEEKFYSRVLSKDQLRVKDRFQDAATNGISVEKKSMPLVSLLEHLSKQLPIIVLVNANVLHCRTCVSDESICLPKNKTSSYAGHFILLIGYSEAEDLFFYLDPAITSHTCSTSFKNIDESRFSYGTDEDILFIDQSSS